MKKILAVLGTVIVYMPVQITVSIVLGITFPSFGASVIHDFLAVMFGVVLAIIVYVGI